MKRSPLYLLIILLSFFVSCDKEEENNFIPGNSKPFTKTLVHSEPSIHQIDFINDMLGFMFKENSILKTKDGGLTWTNQVNLLNKKIDNAVFIDFYSEKLGIVLSSNWSGSEIFKTEDGGKTWKSIFTKENIFEAYFLNDTIIIGVAEERFHKSVNAGRTWKTIHLKPASSDLFIEGYPLKTDIVNDQLLFIAGEGEILVSKNSGTSFEKKNIPPGNLIFFDFYDENLGFANVYNNGKNEMYHTKNGGNTWLESTAMINRSAEKNLRLSCNPIYLSNQVLIASTEQYLLESTDLGETFSVKIVFDKDECDVHAIRQILQTSESKVFTMNSIEDWEGQFCEIALGIHYDMYAIEGL